MTEFAKRTTVPVAQTQVEIQNLLIGHGASAFASGWDGNSAAIEFGWEGRQYRVRLPLPVRNDKSITHTEKNRARTAQQVERSYDAEVRRRWRALLLVIKARLESSETGITTFEEEFALFTVLPTGQTVAEIVMPAINEAYVTGQIPPIMAALTVPQLQGARPAGYILDEAVGNWKGSD